MLVCGSTQSITFVLALIVASALVACSDQTASVQPGNSSPVTPSPQLYPVESNGKYGFVDEDGNLKFTLPDDVYTIGLFSEGLAVVAKRVPNTHGRWGYVDQNGKVVIEARFNLAKTFSEGLAAVVVSENENTSGKIGYIDRTGRMVIQPQFDQGSVASDYAFSEGLAAVPLAHDKWGYIDKTGKFAIAPRFHVALPFSEGRAVVGIAEPAWDAKKYGVIDKLGRWIVEPRYEYVGEFSEGLASILVDHKIGYIDLHGQVVIKPEFSDGGQCPSSTGMDDPNSFSEGLAAVQVDWKWGFIDRSGKWVIKPAFSCALPFSEALALVGVRDQQGRWLFGYIDKTGATVIKPQFSEARSFAGKLANVAIGMSEDEALLKALKDQEAGKPKEQIEKELESNKTKYGLIDRTGKVVWKPTN